VAQSKAITAAGNGSNAPEVRRDPAAELSLGCDQDIEAGTVVHNELLLSGWATSPQAISGVVVQIDERLFNATYGLDTPWTAESRPDLTGADRAGYSLRIDTSEWEPGRRQVTIAAFDPDGRRAEIVGEIEVIPYEEPTYAKEETATAIAAGETVMWLESPAIVEGSCEVEGRVEIRGWAYAKDGLDSVRVMIDGSSIPAMRPIARPDLIEEFGPEVAGKAGFVLTLDPSECPPGPHKLTVVAVGPDGGGVGMNGDIHCLPEPGGEISRPEEPAMIEWMEERRAPRRRDETARRYHPEEHMGTGLEAEHQARYRWAAQLAKGCTALDAGCGFGWGTALLAEAGAKRVFGIDASEEAISEARRRTDRLAVELEHGELYSLPFDDASFDLITCFGVIEHAKDPDLTLAELRRVLRPDGVLLISAARRRAAAAADDHDAPGYTPREFERTLRDSFVNVRLHHQQTCLASTMLDGEALAAGDGKEDLDVDVRKLTEGRPGSEAHIAAAAGDGPLPELGRITVLASPAVIQRLHDRARTWEDRALIAEAEAAAIRVRSNLARMQQEATAKALRARESELESANETVEEFEAARERLVEQDERLVEQQDRLVEQDERIWAQHRQIEEQRRGLERRLVEQDERLVEQQDRLVEQDERIWAQHRQIEEQRRGLERRLVEQDERIWAQHRQIEEQQEQLQRKRELERRLVEQDERLVEQQDRLVEQDERIWAQHRQIEEQQEQLQQSETEVAAWRSSFSARITRPLRAIKRGVQRIRSTILRRGKDGGSN
jgi:SAM-dependent methyltransferase